MSTRQLVSLGLLLLLAAFPSDLAAQGSGRIVGRVVEAQQGAPVAGATVEALYPDAAAVSRPGEDTLLRGLDLVVPTRPMVPVSALASGPAVFDVGDCVAPRTAFEVERRPFYVTEDGKGKSVAALFAKGR